MVLGIVTGSARRSGALIIFTFTFTLVSTFCFAQTSFSVAGTPSPASPLTLSDAERLALETSPALKAAEARIQIEAGRLRQAGLYPNPELALGVTRLTSDWGPKETVLGVLQPIPYHGKRGLERQEAAERLEAARRDRDRERLDLLLGVRETYCRIHFASEVVQVKEDDRLATGEIQKAVRARVAAGDASPVEALKASVEVRRSESQLSLARGDLAATIASFNLLLGLPAEAPTVVAGPPPDPGPAGDLNALVARAVERQPEIQSRQHAAQAAGFAAERARLEHRPDVAIGPTFGTEEGAGFVGLGLVLKIPAWNRNQGNIAAADAGRDEARREADAARLAVSRLVADSSGRYRSARAQQELYENGLLAEAEQLAEAARKSYEGGESGILDLLDARRTALAVREEYYRASLEAALAAARLRRAIGEDGGGAAGEAGEAEAKSQ
jgi:cobalt-zinc-cadmium efflux system outer membrane protein